MDTLSPAQRAEYRCAFIPPEDWRGDGLKGLTFGDVKCEEINRCPGGLVRRRGVIEAASAFAAFDKGALLTFAPSPDQGLLDGIMVLQQAVNAFQAERMRKMRNK